MKGLKNNDVMEIKLDILNYLVSHKQELGYSKHVCNKLENKLEEVKKEVSL